jgi:hypothetical protein
VLIELVPAWLPSPADHQFVAVPQCGEVSERVAHSSGRSSRRRSGPVPSGGRAEGGGGPAEEIHKDLLVLHDCIRNNFDDDAFVGRYLRFRSVVPALLFQRSRQPSAAADQRYGKSYRQLTESSIIGSYRRSP